MIAYIFLALFTIAAVIFIVNSHYHWTYFFAITLFTFFIWWHAYGFWPMATSFKFFICAFCGTDVISPFKNSLLQTAFVNFRFLSCGGLAKLGTLIHYKGALFGVIGLLALLGYAIFGFNYVESLGILGNSIGVLCLSLALA